PALLLASPANPRPHPQAPAGPASHHAPAGRTLLPPRPPAAPGAARPAPPALAAERVRGRPAVPPDREAPGASPGRQRRRLAERWTMSSPVVPEWPSAWQPSRKFDTGVTSTLY